MYLEHFGLRETPFSLTPDTSYFFSGTGHQEALNVLLVALRSGEGFVKITGEVGTGKTLLCRKLLNSLQEEFVTAYLPNPLLSPLELHKAIADELGLPFPPEATVQELLKLINKNLIELNSQDKRVVLCIDEVQSMPEISLEALRLISNLETEKRKLLHIVLFGQPELNDHLARTTLRQLQQRITFSHHLSPLTRQGLNGYVNHRLQVAGYQGTPLFKAQALDVISRFSRGIPRLVNILCHKAMLAAYGKGHKTIDKKDALAAVLDTEDAREAKESSSPLPLYTGLGLILLAGITLFIYFYRGN